MKEKNLFPGTLLWEKFIFWRQNSSAYFSRLPGNPNLARGQHHLEVQNTASFLSRRMGCPPPWVYMQLLAFRQVAKHMRRDIWKTLGAQPHRETLPAANCCGPRGSCGSCEPRGGVRVSLPGADGACLRVLSSVLLAGRGPSWGPPAPRPPPQVSPWFPPTLPHWAPSTPPLAAGSPSICLTLSSHPVIPSLWSFPLVCLSPVCLSVRVSVFFDYEYFL